MLEDIRRNAYVARTMTNDYKDMLVAAKTEKKQAEVERCKRELKKADKRISDLTKILNKLYENVALEKITEERYQTMAPGYEREQEMLKAQREKLVEEDGTKSQRVDIYYKFIGCVNLKRAGFYDDGEVRVQSMQAQEQ